MILFCNPLEISGTVITFRSESSDHFAKAMASLLYKDFLIVAGADFQSLTGTWSSIASISWKAEGKQEIRFLSQTTERHDSANDAVDFGIALAKAWVDRRLADTE